MASKNAEKGDLPPGWVVKVSRKHPDRIFYFNVDSGESSWNLPTLRSREDDSDDSETSTVRVESRSRERKNGNLLDRSDSESSCISQDKLIEALNQSSRPILKAKKTLPSQEPGNAPSTSSNDTPAMKLYREKLAQRQAQIAAKKGGVKIPKSDSSKSKLNKSLVTITKPKISQIRKRRASSVSSTSSNVSNSSVATQILDIGNKTVKETSRVKSPILSRRSTRIPKLTNRGKELPKPQEVTHQVRVTLENIKETTNKISKSNGISNNQETNVENLDSSSSKLSDPRRSSGTFANDRLDRLKKNLSDERKNPQSITNKRLRKKSLEESPNNDIDIDTNENNIPKKSKLLENSETNYRKLAYRRLHSLENRVEEYNLLEILKKRQSVAGSSSCSGENEQERKLFEQLNDRGKHCNDSMDWEPIEDEKITSEVHSVRYELYEHPLKNATDLMSVATAMPLSMTEENNVVYIVIDTNVFLSNLEFVKEVRDATSNVYGRPFLVIPWTVIQELDYIKDDKNNVRAEGLKKKAEKAVKFLNHHFSSKHPRFLGQCPEDVEKNKEQFAVDCPDDEILQTCLQIKSASKAVVLLSYDKNLCTKAIIHDIITLGKNEPLEKIEFLKAADQTSEFLSNSLHGHIEKEQENYSLQRQELLLADDVMEEAKAIIKSVLSAVVAAEMENLFGSKWEMHVIIRPPWTIGSVIKCALKHWMAAVSESFIRKAEVIIKDIQICINNPPTGGRKLHDVKHFIDKCHDLIQTLVDTKQPLLKNQANESIKALKERCKGHIEDISKKRFKEYVGSAENIEEEKNRAELAYNCFEEVYSFVRDTCGITAEILGMQCSFLYDKNNRYLTAENVYRIYKDVAASLHRLYQALSIALERVNSEADSSDSIIISLYESLRNFTSEIEFQYTSALTPLDIYCCIKWKKEVLRHGLNQLNELSIHFCRMASYQCI